MMKTNKRSLRELFAFWDENDHDLLENVSDGSRVIVDDSNDESRSINTRIIHRFLDIHPERAAEHRLIRAFNIFYYITAVFVCLLLSGTLIWTVGALPVFGDPNTPHNNEVYVRYIENGLEETGAVNAVAGMILDYRAFDTLGESHVLFTALMCVMIMLKNTKKATVTDDEDESESFHLTSDVPLKQVVRAVIPFIFVFGAYVILTGHLGPGGGFSGGAILGAGLILLSIAYGGAASGRLLSEKVFKGVTCSALCFYSLSKAYSFFTGANGIENIIPKGEAGAILSAGLILPLDIAVGLVVACTMYGFWSLFTRGKI